MKPAAPCAPASTAAASPPPARPPRTTAGGGSCPDCAAKDQQIASLMTQLDRVRESQAKLIREESEVRKHRAELAFAIVDIDQS